MALLLGGLQLVSQRSAAKVSVDCCGGNRSNGSNIRNCCLLRWVALDATQLVLDVQVFQTLVVHHTQGPGY